MQLCFASRSQYFFIGAAATIFIFSIVFVFGTFEKAFEAAP